MPSTSRAADAPADLNRKRDALTAVQAETRAEQHTDDDGRIVVTLTTRYGWHDMHVPPYEEWTSIARHAMNREDGLTWAQQTLSPADAVRWLQLNPTVKDEREFFEEWGRRLGQSLGE